SFGLPHGESLEARVALAEEGRVESLSLRAHNQGRHGRTIFQAKDDLAAWLAKGPLSSLRWSEGDITLQGPQGPMTIRAKHLCCEAAEGENIGAQVCSNEYGYDFRFICGGWYGPGWRD